MRLFTAITIPEEVKDRLAEMYYPIDGLKWQEKSQMHLTLRFIGEVDEETAHRVVKTDIRSQGNEFIPFPGVDMTHGLEAIRRTDVHMATGNILPGFLEAQPTSRPTTLHAV